ncbi:MAG: YHS domain protein [Rickettsiales bacterium]|nr:YHS domain protein [Rickettsiales bacterium]
MRNFLKVFVLSFIFMTSSQAMADDPIYTSFLSDKAVSGYDVVAYFKQGVAVKGKQVHSLKYKDAVWLFSTAENKEVFLRNPEKYEPQYGGYCAYAVAKGSLASSDPEAWTIHDGKLYLNYDKDIQKEWESNMQNFIEKGDQNFPDLIQ